MSEPDWNFEEPLRADDMDVVGSLFGLRFVEGGLPNGLVELYVEDDEYYHYKTQFNHFWLNDLAMVVEIAKEHFNVKS